MPTSFPTPLSRLIQPSHHAYGSPVRIMRSLAQTNEEKGGVNSFVLIVVATLKKNEIDDSALMLECTSTYAVFLVLILHAKVQVHDLIVPSV